MRVERMKFLSTAASPAAPGYGLHVTDFLGIIGHDGALPGFQSFVGFVPARNATIVVLTNLYPDNTCKGPADEIVKLIGKQLGLFRP